MFSFRDLFLLVLFSHLTSSSAAPAYCFTGDTENGLPEVGYAKVDLSSVTTQIKVPVFDIQKNIYIKKSENAPISEHQNIQDVDNCKTQCVANEKCLAFTYFSSAFTCWLHNKGDGMADSSEREQVGLKKTKKRVTKWGVQNDQFGAPASKTLYRILNIEACMTKCADTWNCLAVTYYKRVGANCYQHLFGYNVRSSTRGAKHVVGVEFEELTSYEIQNDNYIKKSINTPIGEHQNIKNFEACKKKCTENVECSAFTYFSTALTCWLHSNGNGIVASSEREQVGSRTIVEKDVGACAVYWTPDSTKLQTGKWTHLATTDEATWCGTGSNFGNIYSIGPHTGYCTRQSEANTARLLPSAGVALRCRDSSNEEMYMPESWNEKKPCVGACKVTFTANQKYTWSCIPADRYHIDCIGKFHEVVGSSGGTFMCCKEKNCEPGNPPVSTPPGVAADIRSLTCVQSSGASQPHDQLVPDRNFEICTNEKNMCHTTYNPTTRTYTQGCALGTCKDTALPSDGIITGEMVNCCAGTNCNDVSKFTSKCWKATDVATPQNTKTMVTPSNGAEDVCIWIQNDVTQTFTQGTLTAANFKTSACSGVLDMEVISEGKRHFCCRGFGCNVVPEARLNPQRCLSSSNTREPTAHASVKCGPEDVSCVFDVHIGGSGDPATGKYDQACTKTACTVTKLTDATGNKRRKCCKTGNNCNEVVPVKCFQQDFAKTWKYEVKGTDDECPAVLEDSVCYWTKSSAGKIEQGCSTSEKCKGSINQYVQLGGGNVAFCCASHLCNTPPSWSALSCLTTTGPSVFPVSLPNTEECALTDNFCSWVWSQGKYQQRCQPTCVPVDDYAGCCTESNCNIPPTTRCYEQTSYQSSLGTVSSACAAEERGDVLLDFVTEADNGPKTHCLSVVKLGATPEYIQKCVTATFFWKQCRGQKNQYIAHPETGPQTHGLYCCEGNNCNNRLSPEFTPVQLSEAGRATLTLVAMVLLAA